VDILVVHQCAFHSVGGWTGIVRVTLTCVCAYVCVRGVGCVSGYVRGVQYHARGQPHQVPVALRHDRCVQCLCWCVCLLDVVGANLLVATLNVPPPETQGPPPCAPTVGCTSLPLTLPLDLHTITGFTSAAGLFIGVSQLKTILGVHLEGEFHYNWMLFDFYQHNGIKEGSK
jgi:hypothetical protein